MRKLQYRIQNSWILAGREGSSYFLFPIFLLFYFILYYLFYFILFYFILFYFILFYFLKIFQELEDLSKKKRKKFSISSFLPKYGAKSGFSLPFFFPFRIFLFFLSFLLSWVVGDLFNIFWTFSFFFLFIFCPLFWPCGLLFLLMWIHQNNESTGLGFAQGKYTHRTTAKNSLKRERRKVGQSRIWKMGENDALFGCVFFEFFCKA